MDILWSVSYFIFRYVSLLGCPYMYLTYTFWYLVIPLYYQQCKRKKSLDGSPVDIHDTLIAKGAHWEDDERYSNTLRLPSDFIFVVANLNYLIRLSQGYNWYQFSHVDLRMWEN